MLPARLEARMESLSPFLQGSFIPYNRPVVPKPLPTNRVMQFGIWRDVDREAEPAKRSEMVMGALLPSSLLRRILRTPIGDASRQHTVKHV
jgi:hypothetical protein